jgi:hypothetical protein
VISVDKGEAKLARRRDLADEIRFAAGVDSHGRNQVRDQIRNFETDRPRSVDDAMGLGIDGLDGDLVAAGIRSRAGSRAGDE